ncbi:uncharacterized protein HKW66_Vig0080060 [Vigna angularis]|uniref:Uncharacterized protein n=1 Tax=Phaseolus angularis TaxID=3914 RepID=A0A8T0KKF0_PHAAN|nr:uncharacterized protein HKW66_Vig0080060 [Vigna angularis]
MCATLVFSTNVTVCSVCTLQAKQPQAQDESSMIMKSLCWTSCCTFQAAALDTLLQCGMCLFFFPSAACLVGPVVCMLLMGHDVLLSCLLVSPSTSFMCGGSPCAPPIAFLPVCTPSSCAHGLLAG